ncbi:MAG: hypothetical protein HOO67_01685 [Candidatus Peribacteraceae bacterium]|nr:hypothetical protein [Candidatus Peribacteraceae bacterium]
MSITMPDKVTPETTATLLAQLHEHMDPMLFREIGAFGRHGLKYSKQLLEDQFPWTKRLQLFFQETLGFTAFMDELRFRLADLFQQLDPVTTQKAKDVKEDYDALTKLLETIACFQRIVDETKRLADATLAKNT